LIDTTNKSPDLSPESLPTDLDFSNSPELIDSRKEINSKLLSVIDKKRFIQEVIPELIYSQSISPADQESIKASEQLQLTTIATFIKYIEELRYHEKITEQGLPSKILNFLSLPI